MTDPISQRCSSHNPYSPLLSWHYSNPDGNDLGRPSIVLLTRVRIIQDGDILKFEIELTISVIPAIPNAFTCPGLKCAKCTPTPRSWYAFVSSYKICVALYGIDQRSVNC